MRVEDSQILIQRWTKYEVRLSIVYCSKGLENDRLSRVLFPPEKRYGSCQKTVTVKLKSRRIRCIASADKKPPHEARSANYLAWRKALEHQSQGDSRSSVLWRGTEAAYRCPKLGQYTMEFRGVI